MKRTSKQIGNASHFTNNPTAVDGHAMDRLDELLGVRQPKELPVGVCQLFIHMYARLVIHSTIRDYTVFTAYSHTWRSQLFTSPSKTKKVIHFMGDEDSGGKILVHVYNFLFFEGKLCKLASMG